MKKIWKGRRRWWTGERNLSLLRVMPNTSEFSELSEFSEYSEFSETLNTAYAVTGLPVAPLIVPSSSVTMLPG